MNILQVKNLSKIFDTAKGKFYAVDNVSFDLKEGEILGMLGPNGAGKTTTIQMLLGVLTPSSGEIIYFGKNIQKNREEALEKINFSSTYTDFPHNLTVYENLKYFSFFYEIKNRRERLNNVINMFRLKKISHQQINSLSAGQKTRVNLAKAFLNFPKILLLDEPTASLDPESALYIRNFLLSERAKFNVSIILTSHNMAEVEEVCDRVIFIDKGKIIADDTPAGLAKSIDLSHIELFVKDGLKRLIEYCQKNSIPHKIKSRYIIIDVKETQIPDFLRQIMDMGVFYDEISIEKPSLNDYFIQVASKKNESS